MLPVDQAGSVFSAVEKWTLRRLGSVDHERQVASIAQRLVELTSSKITLDAEHRRLLMLGAMIHDVGRCEDDARHPQIGAKMIESAPSLPLTKSQRRAVCYLTRYHRGAVPRIGKDDYLTDRDDREQLLTVMAYLRAADALDNRNLQSPQLTFALRRNHLDITAHLSEDSSKARRVYRRRRKFKLLEERLGIDLRLEAVNQIRAKTQAN